jgi:uncharacterized membrane protein
MVMSTNRRVQKIAMTGVLSALVIVLGLTGIGFIRIPPVAITVLHVPVIIGAILEGPIVGSVIGLLFGIFSLIQAAITPSSPLDAAFLNPLISILPRVFIGLFAWLVYQAIAGKAEAGSEDARSRPVIKIIAMVASATVGTLTNTVFVLSALGIFKQLPWSAIPPIVLVNSPLEVVFANVIVIAVVSAWNHVSLGGKSRLSRKHY